MPWIELNFGKHVGRSLPWVVLSDPGWFFWAVEKRTVLVGPLAKEASELLRKLRCIKILKPHPEKWRVEYRYDENGSFREIEIVKSREFQHRLSRRAPYLDFLSVRPSGPYDKKTYLRLTRDFRNHYFVGNLTKRRCEAFFDDDSNFVELD